MIKFKKFDENDVTYFAIIEDYIILYQQKFVSLGSLRNVLQSLATALQRGSLDWYENFLEETNDLEIVYASMLDAQRTTLLDHELQRVNNTIGMVQKMILMCKSSTEFYNKKNANLLYLEEFYNSRYILIMEDYITIYKQRYIKLSKLHKVLMALIDAVWDFCLSMTTLKVTETWHSLITQEIEKFSYIINPNNQEKKQITYILSCIEKLLTTYKTNFRECLRSRPIYDLGTGIAIAHLNTNNIE